eukprot:2948076-Pleurochrysis_carterae.AAC.1
MTRRMPVVSSRLALPSAVSCKLCPPRPPSLSDQQSLSQSSVTYRRRHTAALSSHSWRPLAHDGSFSSQPAITTRPRIDVTSALSAARHAESDGCAADSAGAACTAGAADAAGEAGAAGAAGAAARFAVGAAAKAARAPAVPPC